ncbi:MAG: glycoside hydrolase family 2 protein [Muribaculaceae bacterium]|nr:glycoside hydrolase family 2 protein [Muribaculaceae bacterium]
MARIEKLIALAALSANAAAFAAVHTQNLGGEWKFRQSRTVQWHKAQVPGTVHTDLMDCGLIPDPFIGQNERQVQWVDKEDWIYERDFNLDTAMLADHVNLVFDGLDTYADVYLNDSLVLKADNMFRRWEVPVEGLLKPSDNTLRVYFHSPIKVDLPKFEALPFQYDAGNDQSQNGGIFDKRVSVFARKAGYHYGWDWGPRLVTSGIWRPVYLEAWSGPKINDVYVRTSSIAKNKAEMTADIEIDSDIPVSKCELSLADKTSGAVLARRKLNLTQGMNSVSIPFSVKNPRLWWCNGLGTPDMYDFEVRLDVGGKNTDSRVERTGIRLIEVVRDEDAEGRSFYFRLNGVPVFAKGANYIPCDNFLPRVTDEVYRRTIQDAADANMNMLRVWGGGVYEDDRFYELCDSLGIMVWQDFMFACSLYPSEGELLENIRKEAVYNVRRLRNHPSIVLWCGNNECLEAWYNWGWRRRYTAQGYADVIWKQFHDLYHRLLPEVVAENAPDAFYWPSSPFSRVDGPPEPNRGDTHLWLVWGGGEPIDTYNHKRSRFFSEYGFQSFPQWSTVLKYAPDTTQHRIDSDVMLAHQRAGADANRKIERYLLESYPEPKDFRSFLYMSQVLQGDAIRTAMEAHRRDRPYCMGTLFWQHNDCWPVASWSSRDYYGRWKAQHYFAKKAYRDIMLSTRVEGDSVKVYVVSDRVEPVTGTLSLTTGRLDGTAGSLYSEDMRCDVDGGSVVMITYPLETLSGGADPSALYIRASFDDGTETYENVSMPVEPKYAEFVAPDISLELAGVPGEYKVNVSSRTFVRAFCMSLDADENCFFTDNYFDLIPGRTYTVDLRSDMSPDDVRRNLSWTSLYNAAHQQ